MNFYSPTIADDIDEIRLNTNRLKVSYNTVNALYDTVFATIRSINDKESNVDDIVNKFMGYHITSRSVYSEYKFQNQKYNFDKVYNVFLKDCITLSFLNKITDDMNDVLYRFIYKIMNTDSVSEMTPIFIFIATEYVENKQSLCNEIIDFIYDLQKMIDFETAPIDDPYEYDPDEVYDKHIIPDIDPSDKEYVSKLFDELVKKEEELIELIKKHNEK